MLYFSYMTDFSKYLQPVRRAADIPQALRRTPLGRLLEYHNCARPPLKHHKAEILVCMCMDNRKQLSLPDNFAYILRTGGGNMRYNEFKISYAVGIGGGRHVAMIAHDNCGMVDLAARRDKFVSGLVKNGGWTRKDALRHFLKNAPRFEIGNELEFVQAEAKRLNKKYPRVKVVPMFYRVADRKLYLVKAPWITSYFQLIKVR